MNRKIILCILCILCIPILVLGADQFFDDQDFMGYSLYNFTWANGTYFNGTYYGDGSHLTGVADITAVNTDGDYLTGGAASGAVSLLLNETVLNDTIDNRDSDTTYTAEEDYIYLDSTTFKTNETVLNATIDDRDSDTTYTNSTGLSLVGTAFSVMLSYFQGLFLELTDSFGGDVSGTYDNLLVVDTQGLTHGNITDEPWIEDSQEGNLNVNHSTTSGTADSATSWDSETSQADLNVNDSDYLDGIDSTGFIETGDSFLNNSGDVAVSGTYGALVLTIDHNALDDQYYDSEADLTTLLDDNYADIAVITDNASWNESHADTLYADIGVTGDNTSWNESYATSIYAPINYGDDWNKTYADTLYSNDTNTDTQDLSYDTGTDVISLTDGGSIDITEVDTDTTYTNITPINLTGTVFSLGFCADNEVWKMDGAAWNCEADADSGSYTLNLTGDSGTVQVLATGNVIDIAGGTNGIDTVVGATDTVTINIDWSEVAADSISEAKIDFDTSCAAGNHYYLNGDNLACEADDDTTYTAGDQNLTLTGTAFSLNNTWIDARFYNTEAELTTLLDDNYRAESWDNITGIPHATPSDADVTHFSLADEIYDWVIGLSYSAFGATVDDTEMTAEDFGEFTCTGDEDGCTLNTGSFDDEYIELADAFVGDVTGTYGATTVVDTQGLLWGNISGGWDLNVVWTGTLGGDNITDATIDESELAANCVKLSELDVTDVSDDIAGDIAEGELADSIVVEADLKCVNSPADEDIFTYESTTGDFQWHTKAEMSIGDMNDVVDDTGPQLGGDLDCNAHNLELDSSTKLCLDGNTCSKYIYYDGSNVIIQG